MSETAGPAPGYIDRPEHFVEVEPSPKRIRVAFGDQTIIDTDGALIVHERAHVPIYYLPRCDAAMDLLTATEHSTYCPFKGDASYFTVNAGGRTAENAVWSYVKPFDEAAGLKDYLAFYWDKMDSWHEGNEEVFVHARSPRVRVDILDSSRAVRVAISDNIAAETNRARLLLETGLPARYYIPRDDVFAELLPSERHTICPYKGKASYHHVRVGAKTFENIVWYYPDPVRESAGIKDYLCFCDEQADVIYIDGVARKTPKPKWPRQVCACYETD